MTSICLYAHTHKKSNKLFMSYSISYINGHKYGYKTQENVHCAWWFRLFPYKSYACVNHIDKKVFSKLIMVILSLFCVCFLLVFVRICWSKNCQKSDCACFLSAMSWDGLMFVIFYWSVLLICFRFYSFIEMT